MKRRACGRIGCCTAENAISVGAHGGYDTPRSGVSGKPLSLPRVAPERLHIRLWGKAFQALLSMIKQAGATVAELDAQGYRVESLARVKSLAGGTVTFVE